MKRDNDKWIDKLTDEEKELLIKFLVKSDKQLQRKKEGEQEIEVAEILMIGPFCCPMSEFQPKVVIKDSKGDIWAIPEDASEEENRLASRYDVKPRMKLKITIEKINGGNFISKVLVIKEAEEAS